MMMSKPDSRSADEATAKPKSRPGDAVADLERRLADLGSFSSPSTTTNTAPTPAPTPVTPAAAASGKNALLARIMAAQEKAKGGNVKPNESMKSNEAPPPDFFASLDPPPPAFETMEQEAPPAFDLVQDTLPYHQQQQQQESLWESPPSEGLPPYLAAPSAPALEDLLGFDDNNNSNTQHHHQQHAPDFISPYGGDLEYTQPLPPPQQQEQTAEEIINAIEGLTDEEKKALLAEQAQILEQIAKNKPNPAASAADAFESRSFSAAVRSVGGSRGPSSVNTMDIVNEAGLTPEEVAQLAADAKLAEELQQEEYREAERRQEQQQSSGNTSSPTSGNAAASSQQSWMEWLGMSSSTPTNTATSPERPPDFAQRPLQRGEIGVSRPPGSAARDGGSGGLSAVQTGEEPSIRYQSRSYDDDNDEANALVRARVAKSQPLFSCVTDSITSAASSMMTYSLPGDEEGNVHGVDSSGLLAMPNINRDQNSNNNNGSRDPY